MLSPPTSPNIVNTHGGGKQFERTSVARTKQQDLIRVPKTRILQRRGIQVRNINRHQGT